ncbi:MAG: hypothetical protein DWQ44_05160 [Bacteroidetes bacterium]|nr:MAG: hypothetical protein DWQ33_11805 [Bacteroidota bacterium]REK00765.1 MAG: hypothetical protein DWQ39_11480 [Bacteroidota bacterium]REK35013.1 MAG: hypothetical protein DWQ44_05160 [Bacteroidota bacterium]REK48189.1 MAG: hypothetical protein DWQ48_10185 [Bacteroidota bacterium]
MKIIRSVLIVIALLLAKISFAQSGLPKSEQEFQNYFKGKKDSLDRIEGIWSVITTQEYYRYDTLYDVIKYPKPVKVAILSAGNGYDTYNLNGASYNVKFSRTDVPGVYLYRNYFEETSEYSRTQAVISKSGEMEYNYEFPEEYLKLKFKDSYESGTKVVNVLKWNRILPAQD